MHTRWICTIVFAVFALLLAGHAVAQVRMWQAEGWKTDFGKTGIDFSEVMSGGPPKDGIPPIDNPQFVEVVAEKSLAGREPVVSIAVNGDARAYPLRVLTWHEIVNDVVGGEPLAVTFCPLCNAALVFERRLDGKVLDFGTTGKLRNSDLIMYDRQSESWWQQFTGRGIVGIHTGRKLQTVPARLESWQQFMQRHPNGKVLVPANPSFRPYGQNPYVNYDGTDRPFLFRGELPKGIDPMARVVVIRGETDTPVMIMSLQAVRDHGPVVEKDVTISWSKGQASALDSSSIAKGREVGTIVAQRNVGGTMQDIAHDVTFAFVAHAFHPGMAIRQR